MVNKLKSRKLWAAVSGAAILAFGTSLGISEAVSVKIATLIGAYILGQGIADINKPQ